MPLLPCCLRSLFGQDIVEFIIRQDAVNNRGWAGDADEGQLVTFRSMAGAAPLVRVPGAHSRRSALVD